MLAKVIAAATGGVLLLGLLLVAAAWWSDAVPASVGAVGVMVVQTTTPIALLITVALVMRR